jgi:glycosyltransferase involved in cell wall biosynthesis
MKRHMDLHAEGLNRLGHRATVIYAEDMVGFERLRSLRAPGARTLAVLLGRYRSERPDVVNVHTECAPAWITARRAGLVSAKIVVMSYAADEPSVTIRRPRDLLSLARFALPARTTYPHADGIWCVNQQDAEYYVGTYGVARERVGRYPHAVAEPFYEASGVRSPRQLLFVGTWSHRKGKDVLARALERVVTEDPGVRVVLAGTLSGPDEVTQGFSSQLAERTRVLPLAGDAELVALYAESTLLLVPSRREGLPITMLEAMACGCPPLAAANSGMLDAVQPGENGWLEVSFDPARWSEQILRILREPGPLARARDGARRTAEAFRIEKVARDVAAWYETLGA